MTASADYRMMHKQSAWCWPQVIENTSDKYLNEAGNSYFA